MGRALQSKDIFPLLPQGVLLIRKVAAFATFKKDTTLERQGEFTLSTLQRAVLAQARGSRKVMIPAIKGGSNYNLAVGRGYHWLTYYKLNTLDVPLWPHFCQLILKHDSQKD